MMSWHGTPPSGSCGDKNGDNAEVFDRASFAFWLGAR